MSDKHWIEDEKTRKRFWPWAMEHLTDDEVHEALGVESVKDFEGTMAEAKVLIEQAVEVKITGKHEKREQEEERLYRAATELPCTPMWASTDFISPAGYKWRYCFDIGLPSDLCALALDQVCGAVLDFEELATKAGWLVPGALNGAPARRLVAAESQAADAGPPAGPQDTLPVQSGNGGGDRQVLETEFIKITAPKGTPRLEFWRPNRQYPEIFWALSIEAFLQIAPSLVEAGWTVEKLGKVGEQYTIPLRIEWVPSPKNPKWKDIKAAELRQ